LREAHRGSRQDRCNVVTGSDPLPGFLRLHGTATFSLDLFVGSTAPNGLSNGLIWPKTGCASIAYAAMAPINFLPLSAARSFLAKQESGSGAILRWRCGPSGCGVDRLRPVDRHRGRNGAGSELQIKEN